jgi:hypothetical protein
VTPRHVFSLLLDGLNGQTVAPARSAGVGTCTSASAPSGRTGSGNGFAKRR